MRVALVKHIKNHLILQLSLPVLLNETETSVCDLHVSQAMDSICILGTFLQLLGSTLQESRNTKSLVGNFFNHIYGSHDELQNGYHFKYP